MVSFTRGKGKNKDAEQAMRLSEEELLRLTEEQQKTAYYQALNASEKALFDSLNTAFQGDLNLHDLSNTNLLQSLTKTLTILNAEGGYYQSNETGNKYIVTKDSISVQDADGKFTYADAIEMAKMAILDKSMVEEGITLNGSRKERALLQIAIEDVQNEINATLPKDQRIKIKMHNAMSRFKHRDAFALQGIGGANGKRKKYLKTHPVDYVLKDQDGTAPANERVEPTLDDPSNPTGPEPAAADAATDTADVEPIIPGEDDDLPQFLRKDVAEPAVETEASEVKAPVFTGDAELDAQITADYLAGAAAMAEQQGFKLDEQIIKPEHMEALWSNLDPNIQKVYIETAQKALEAKALEAKALEAELAAGMAEELGIPQDGTLDAAIEADSFEFKGPDENGITDAEIQAALDDAIANDPELEAALDNPYNGRENGDAMSASQWKSDHIEATYGEVDLSTPAEDPLMLLPSMRTDLPTNILTGDPEADTIIEGIVRDELFAKGKGTVADITGEWNSFEPAHQEDLKRFAKKMIAQNEANAGPERLVNQDIYDRIAAHVIEQGTGSQIKRNDIKALLVQEGYTGDKRKAVSEIVRTMDETGVTRFEGYNKRVVAPTEPFNEAAPHTYASDEIGAQVKIAETGLETARGALGKIVALEAAAKMGAAPATHA